MEFIQTDLFTYVILPLFIFCARIIDVSLGTMRIIFVTKGMRKVAPIIGFFEVFVWLLAISRIMQNLDNWVCYVAYAGGFATGNLIGMMIEEKHAIGHKITKVNTPQHQTKHID